MKDKKLRNQMCPCNSGKKFKNCHQQIFNKAAFNIRKNQDTIDTMLSQIVRTNLIKSVDGKFPVRRKETKHPGTFIYTVCGINCLKVEYGDMPVEIKSIADHEAMAKVCVDDIKRTVLIQPSLWRRIMNKLKRRK